MARWAATCFIFNFGSVQALRMSEETNVRFQDAATMPDAGPQKLKEKEVCGKEHHYLGRKKNAEDCSMAVKAFGGKFFSYGRSWGLSRKCYVQFASAETCPEGWQKSTFFDFYMIPSVSMEDSQDILTGGARLVKEGQSCNSHTEFLGTFDTLAKCSATVAVAGGKFFNYDKRWFRDGNCYHVFTDSETCPEGFKEGNIDFYELPYVSARQAVGSVVNDVTVKVRAGNNEQHTLVNEKVYKADTTVIGHRTTQTGWNLLFRRNTHCNQEFRLGRHAGEVGVETYEACCYAKWKGKNTPPCDPGTDRKFKRRVPLEKRGKSWKTCGDKKKDQVFEGTAPGKPLVAQGEHDVLCLEVDAETERKVLWDEVNDCSTVHRTWIKGSTGLVTGVGNFLRFFYSNSERRTRSKLDSTTFDKYTRTMYNLVEVEAQRLKGGAEPAKKQIELPTETKLLDRVSTYSFTGLATTELDGDKEKNKFTQRMACMADIVRKYPREEIALLNGKNAWDRPLTKGCPDKKEGCSKKQFMTGLFYNFKNGDKETVYPTSSVDMQKNWLVAGNWQDDAERYLTFNSWVAHRVEPSDRDSFSYMARSNDFGALTVKPGFGKVGADMYFDQTGLPALIVTPEGEEMTRESGASWQYWKFVWRSSMMIKVALVDNVWGTHMVAANSLAAASRETLSGKHALRRLLTLFTYHTIEGNSREFPQWIAPDSLLDRSLPFANFQQVSEVSMAALKSLQEQFGFLLGDRSSVEGIVDEMPYMQDSPVLYGHLHSLMRRWFDLHSEWCAADGTLVDGEITSFMQRMETWSAYEQKYGESDQTWLGMRTPNGGYRCEGVVNWLAVMAFHVTGFHNQVSSMSTDVIDPDFVGFSWAANEASSRPRQSVDAALLMAQNSARRYPTLTEDFSFVAKGLAKGQRATLLLQSFQADMFSLRRTIQAKNTKRSFPFTSMDPDHVSVTAG